MDRQNKINDRKAICRKCKVVMNDAEPFSGSKTGEYYHPNNDCRYQNKLNLEAFKFKKQRRASKRGAKAASKLRPK